MIIIEVVNNMEEYFKIILGGLYGIATIVVAVMQIASNVINKKYLNMNVNKMKRYRIWFQFLPIYSLILYSIVIMKWSWMASNDFIVIGGILVFLLITTICSYYAAQYSINTEKFQESLLKASKKNLEKKLQENNYENSIVLDYLKEANRTVNEEDCRIFQDEISKEKMYREYLKLLDVGKLQEDQAIDVLNLMVSEFGVDKAFQICNIFKNEQLTLILVSSIDGKTNLEIIKNCIERIHSYFVFSSLTEDLNYEYYSKIIFANKGAMLISRKYFIETIKYLMSSKFVLKDALYLMKIIGQIFDIEQYISIDDLQLDDKTKQFLKELLESKKTFRWPYKENERDEAFQTALLMLGGVKNG